MKINGNNALTYEPSNYASFPKIELDELATLGDAHIWTNIETPVRDDAFQLEDNEKMERISFHFSKIMETLGLDLNDDSLKGTPQRVAKMYIKEVFHGLDPKNKPEVTLFDNKFGYNEMLVEKDIKVHSYCEHHFVPILGRAHIAYFSHGKVIGLSKINRIVDYYSRRPQVQERLTIQIAEELKKILKTEDVAVIIDSAHMCVITRGVQDVNSTTVTASYHGKFKEKSVKEEFLTHIGNK